MLTLDTNILIAYCADDELAVRYVSARRRGGTSLFISVVTEIELLSFTGLKPGDVANIERALRELTIVSLDSQLGRIAADIRRRSGLRLADSVVVATAKLTGSKLATLDKEILRKTRGIVEFEIPK